MNDVIFFEDQLFSEARYFLNEPIKMTGSTRKIFKGLSLAISFINNDFDFIAPLSPYVEPILFLFFFYAEAGNFLF